jgi:hypothetical protein
MKTYRSSLVTSKNLAPFVFAAVIAMMARATNALAEPSKEDEIKQLALRYGQVEAQLDRSIHYTKSETVDGVTTVRQAWLNGADDLMKVTVERIGPDGRELTEYVAEDFGLETMFVLTRKETPVTGGDTQIDESRRYFVGGNLARELKKSGSFKPGDSLDTVHLPNVRAEAAKPLTDQKAEEERSRVENEFLSRPEKIAAELREAGPPQTDPFVNVKGEGEKFRVIHGSVSPDGRYAIALGFARKEINWDDFIEKEREDVAGKSTYFADMEEDVRNYVIDLATQRILGETGCNYFGTRSRYNHRECALAWSSDSTNFVQLWSDKWADTACVAGQIVAGPKLGGVTDLLKVLDAKTYAFLKKRAGDMPGLSIQIERVGNDGGIELSVSASISSGERKGETLFSLAESVQLRKTATSLRAEVLKIRRLPNEP